MNTLIDGLFTFYLRKIVLEGTRLKYNIILKVIVVVVVKGERFMYR